MKITLEMKHINKFNELLEKELYFEAHEALEEFWFPNRFSKTDEVLLIKGFINAAVSFELSKRGRDKAWKKPFKTFEKYLPLLQKQKNFKVELENTKDYIYTLHNRIR